MALLGLPLDEVGQLRVIQEIQDTDLPPAQFLSIGSDPVTADARASETLLDRCDVVYGDDPSEPAASLIRAMTHGTTEGSLIGCRMVKSRDNLDVDVVGKRQDEVARAEGWVDAPIDEGSSELRSDALDDLGQLTRGAGVGDVIQAHAVILSMRQRLPTPAPARGVATGSGGARVSLDQGGHVSETPDNPSAPSATDAVAPPTAALDKKKSIILGVIGLIFIVLIFWKVIPQVTGSGYQQAFSELEGMTPIALIIIGVAVIAYLVAYGFPFMAAAPGLRYGPSQQVNQAAFAISNGVPAGGAFGLAVQYAMLSSYRISGSAATAAITAVGLWSIFVSLGLPILGVAALSIEGGNSNYNWVAPLGMGILVVIIVGFVLIMRSPKLAVSVGNLGNKLINPLRKHIAKLKDLDLVAPISRFRADMYDVLRKRWLLLTVAQLAVILTQFAIFYAALRGVEGWGSSGTSPLAAFAAFATSQIMLMVPITPGGLGTTDALMIALLQSMGVSGSVAQAADVVWRIASYLPQILIGIVALLLWFRRANRTYAAAKPAEPSGSAASA